MPEIKKPLVAQEEVNTILTAIGKPPQKDGYHIDKDAIKALEERANDYVLTAQAEKTVKAEQDADTDPLTGLLNRRGMLKEIDEAMAEVRRKGGVIHGVMIDLRGFKNYNDRYGHDIGDNALEILAENLSKHIRPYDKIARWGGEEFFLLIKNGNANIANTISQRLHKSLRELPDPFNKIQADMGMASWAGDPNVSRRVLIDRADQAMYFAKKNNLPNVKEWDPSV